MVQERGTNTPEKKPDRHDEPVPDAAGTAEAEKTMDVAANPAEAGAAESQSPEHLNTLLAEAQAKVDESWDQLLRTRAEMENLKRRQAIELEKAHKFALDGFVRELLQVRDSLELGHSAALDETTDIEKLREGTELTLKLLTDVMGKFGVEQIDPHGEPFNPEYHQAMTMQPRDDVPPNQVVTVIQKGYLLNGRLVRPAMVIVSSAASSEQS